MPAAIASSPYNVDKERYNDIKRCCKYRWSTRGKRKENRPEEGRQVKPEMEFRKTAWMILLHLFACFMPSLINNFYTLTRTQSCTFSIIVYSSLILNSSLNAVILIVCNREIKKNIK